MVNTVTLAIFGFVAVSSCGLTEAIRHFALRRKLLDIPNARSSHAAPVPRGGGVAIVAAFLCGVTALNLAGAVDARTFLLVVTTSIVIAIVGFIDDLYSLPARFRFGTQLIAAAGFVGGALTSGIVGALAPSVASTWLLAAAVVVSIVWCTNLFNFMDGIDGIAGCEALFVAAAGGWLHMRAQGDPGITMMLWCLACASAGFLVWNWPPARIFMGDVGSSFIGYVLAAIGFICVFRDHMLPAEWLILGGTFAVDATVTLLRRVFRGDRWAEAHRTHAYQHLAVKLVSHRHVTLMILAINVIWLLPAAYIAQSFPEFSWWVALASLSPLIVLAIMGRAGLPDSSVNTGCVE